MVLLECRRRAPEPVLPEPFRLEGVRVRDRRPDRARPAVTADRRGDGGLRDRRVEHAGSERPARTHDEPTAPRRRSSAAAPSPRRRPPRGTARSRPAERRIRSTVRTALRDRNCPFVTGTKSSHSRVDAVHLASRALRPRVLVQGLRGRSRDARADRPRADARTRRRCSTSPAAPASTSSICARGSTCEGTDLDDGLLDVARERVPDVPLHAGGHARLRPRPAVRRGHLPLQRDRLRRRPRRAGRGGAQRSPATSSRAVSRSSSPGSRPMCGCRTGRTCSPTRSRSSCSPARPLSGLRDERISTTEMHYVVATPAGVEHFVEHHDLYLFTNDEMRSAFESGGARRSTTTRTGLTGRGLWICSR